MQELGKYLLFFGLFLVLSGGLLWIFGGRLSWFGDLPGDIRIERKDFRFYMPLTSMILLSVFLSLLIWIVQRFLK